MRNLLFTAALLLTTAARAGTVDATLPGTPVDVINTASGSWTLTSLPPVGDLAAYRWTHDGTPQFRGSAHTRVMLCRAPATVSVTGGVPLDLEAVTVNIGTYTATAGVAQGSCRIVEDGPLVEPNAAWIAQAIRDGRLPAYRRERAWSVVNPLPIAAANPYDPAVIGASATNPVATASGNFVGVTSGQGGEYTASRGFIHSVDAQVVDLALHGEPLGDARTFERYTWESLAMPQGAVWSAVNHVTADPQFPLAGDRAYSVNLTNQVPPAGADNMVPVASWGRDTAHLENTCYVHWIATGDPVAAICLNRQLAFALADQGFMFRRSTNYSGLGGQERGVYNTITALWKSRDVALHMTSLNGRVLWNAARIEKMRADVFAHYDLRANGLPTPENPNPDPADTAQRKAAGVVAHFALASTSYPLFPALNGKQFMSSSDFELVEYGKEPLYLWSKANDPTMRRWMADSARELTARALYIGGSRGVDQCKDETGSFMPIGETDAMFNPVMPTWTDEKGWAYWVNTAICPTVTNTTFEGANVHTTMELESALLMFREAGVPGLDAALANIATAHAATSITTMNNIDKGAMAKNWGGPAQ